MHRKKRSCEAGNTACMGKIYRESRGYPSYTGKQRDLSETLLDEINATEKWCLT